MFTDIRKLRTFLTVVEAGSLTGAAERLNVAQPWISVQLKQLEASIGINLLKRTKGRAIQLTPAGEKFLLVAKRMLTSCELGAAEIAAIREESRGKLVLGIDPITLYMPETIELTDQFRKKYPRVEVSLISKRPDELFYGLSAGQFDVILTSLPHPEGEIEALPICEYPLHLFVPRDKKDNYSDLTVDGLRGAKIMTLPFSYHPAVFAWLRDELTTIEFEYIPCPEDSAHSLVRYAALMGVATFSPDFSTFMPEIAEKMEKCPIADFEPIKIRWGLMRSGGFRRDASDLFWSFAKNRKLA